MRPPSLARRALRYAIYGAALFAALVSAWGFLIEPNRVVVTGLPLPPPSVPAALDGLRIAVLSDVHAGAPFIDQAKLDRLVVETNQVAPDLVVFLGDFIVGHEPFGKLIEPEK